MRSNSAQFDMAGGGHGEVLGECGGEFFVDDDLARSGSVEHSCRPVDNQSVRSTIVEERMAGRQGDLHLQTWFDLSRVANGLLYLCCGQQRMTRIVEPSQKSVAAFAELLPRPLM